MPARLSSEHPRRMRIPRCRRLSMDVVHFHRQVPTCAHDRICNLTAVAEAREIARTRIAWPVLFLKAFAIVAAKHPQLRQSYLRWPWPHLYQHPHSIGMLATHRDVNDDPWLFWSRFIRPESQSLAHLQRQLDRYQKAPAQKVFRKQWLLSALPTLLRRLCWWWTLNVSGQARSRRAGTFMLTTLGAQGAEIQHPPAFLTGNLTFGPVDRRNRCRVTLAYDHRLMDGKLVAECLTEIEKNLNTVLTEELAKIPSPKKTVEAVAANLPAASKPEVAAAKTSLRRDEQHPVPPQTNRLSWFNWRLFFSKSSDDAVVAAYLGHPDPAPAPAPLRSLAGRNALITGGSTGIGFAIAKALASEGMHVVLAARTREPLEVAAAELKKQGVTAIAVPTDVTDQMQLQHLVEIATREVGPIDVLINNAGVETYRDFHQLESTEIDRTIDTNLTAALQLTRLIVPHMLKQRRGHIVNIASTAGKHGPAFGAAYGASKAGLIAFTQSLRAEYHGSGIRASVVCPGFTHDGGMYERMKTQTGTVTPKLVGSTTATAVARAVVKAIHRNCPELLVNRPPLRAVFALAQLAPRLGGWLVRRTTQPFLRKLANARELASQPSSRKVA